MNNADDNVTRQTTTTAAVAIETLEAKLRDFRSNLLRHIGGNLNENILFENDCVTLQ